MIDTVFVMMVTSGHCHALYIQRRRCLDALASLLSDLGSESRSVAIIVLGDSDGRWTYDAREGT